MEKYVKSKVVFFVYCVLLIGLLACPVQVKAAKKTTTKPVSISKVVQKSEYEFKLAGKNLSSKKTKVLKAGTEIDVKVRTNKEKTRLVVTLDEKIEEVKYTISVKKKSKTIEGEVSKLSKIEILDEGLILVDDTQLEGDSAEAYFHYKVSDQFGNDLTKRYSPSMHVSGCNVVSDKKSNYREGNIVYVNGFGGRVIPGMTQASVFIYVMEQPEISITKNLVVTYAAKPKELDIKGIYSPEEATLDASARVSDTFYLLFAGTDQYGNKITNERGKLEENLLMTITPGLTQMEIENTLYEDVDGNGNFGIKLKSKDNKGYYPGDCVISVTDKRSGAHGEKEIEVGYGNIVETLEVTPPDFVTAGEQMEFEYRALDKEGNEVNDFRELRQIQTDEFRFIRKGDKIRLYRKENAFDRVGIHNSIFRTKTNNLCQVQYIVRPKSRPAVIVGIKDASNGVQVGDTLELNYKNFIIQDQYGNVIPEDTLYEEWANDYTIKARLEGIDGYYSYEDDTVEVANSGSGRGCITLNSTSTYISITGKRQGTVSVTFELRDKAGDRLLNLPDESPYGYLIKDRTVQSELVQKIHVMGETEYQSYTMDELKPVYYNSDNISVYQQKLRVYGVLSSGVKVQLAPNDDYSVNMPLDGEYEDGNKKRGILKGNSGIDVVVYSNLEPEDFIDAEGQKVNSLKRELEIVINDDGTTLKKEVTILNEEPVIASASIRDKNKKSLEYLELTPSTLSNAKLLSEKLGKYINFTDQYGISYNDSSLARTTFTFYPTVSELMVESPDVIVSGNSTDRLTVKNVVIDDTFLLSYHFNGGTVYTTNVIVSETDSTHVE